MISILYFVDTREERVLISEYPMSPWKDSLRIAYIHQKKKKRKNHKLMVTIHNTLGIHAYSILFKLMLHGSPVYDYLWKRDKIFKLYVS